MGTSGPCGMETCIPVPCCQVDARFGPCGMGVCENAHDSCGVEPYGNVHGPCDMGACGNAYALYGNAYERRGYFCGEWAPGLCCMRNAWGEGACRRRCRRPHCRNGPLPKWRIDEMPYCAAVLLQRRAAASRRCCGVSWRVGALTRCRAAALSHSRVAKMTCFCRCRPLVEGPTCKHYHAKRNERRRKGLSHG